MASENNIDFALPSLNFKNDEEHVVEEKSEHLDKYDPLIFCRTCANIDTCLVPIFKEEGLNYNLNKKIEKYLPIQVTEKDDLPVHLCYHCASTLIAWDSLIIGCIEAEKKLTLLKNSAKGLKSESPKCINNESIDSDDELLINKKISKNIKKSEEFVKVIDTSNNLQKKIDFQTHLDLKSMDLEGESNKLWTVLNAAENSSIDRGLDSDRLTLKSQSSRLKKIDLVVTNQANAKEKTNFETENRISPGKEKKFFKCDVCKKVFNRKFNFERHLIVHSGESLTCHACGKQYRRQSVLDRHVKVIHQQIRMAHLSCSFCGKMFSSSQSLEDHFRTHTGERPFICEICGKDFRTRPNLIAHKKIHTGELPFACTLCNYRCRLKSTFIDHCQRHQGTRSCLCSVCGKGFVNNYDLMKHKKTHSKERRFSCGFCRLSFVMKRYLKVHLKTHGLKEVSTTK